MTMSTTAKTATTTASRFSKDNESAKPLLWEKFGLYGRQEQVFDVKLYDRHLSVAKEDSGGGAPLEVFVKDIVGCQLMKCKDPNDSSAYFIVYTYPEKKLFGQPKRRERQTLTFMVNRFTFFDLNLEIANKWKSAILRLKSNSAVSARDSRSSVSLRGRSTQAGRCLVLLNPFGGKGKALTSFTEQVAPVLAEAEMQYNMIVTERPGHAQELIQSLALEEWKCILICSGDGLIFEVLNGLMKRSDWRQAIELPIGVIPCGTGNALAASILWRSGESLKSAAIIPASAFIVTQQLVSPLDMILVETRSSRFYSFLSICYGLIADVDIESEKYRKLGVVRNILGGLVRIFDLRTYRCRISYLQPSTVPAGGSRSRADGSADQKRRHMSDPNVGLANAMGRRRRSATDGKQLALKHHNRTADPTESSSSLPNNPPMSPPPSSTEETSAAAKIDGATTAFQYSMSVPNGFGVFFEGGDKDSSPPPSDNTLQPQTPHRREFTNFSSHAAPDRPGPSCRTRPFTNSDSSSGYTSSELSPEGRTNGLLPGLEPIVEDETEVLVDEQVNQGDDKRVGEGVNSPLAEGDDGACGDPDNSEDDYEKIELFPSRLTAIDEPVPKNWITMETEIVSANVINITHLSTETIAYTGAEINNGQIFIHVIRAGISKAGLLQMLAAMDSSEAPVTHPFVDVIPCDAFRLEPLVEGILTVDGEAIPCSTIQGEVLPGMARVLVGEEKVGRRPH